MRTKEDRGKGVEEDVVPPLFPETILVLKWYGTDKIWARSSSEMMNNASSD